MATTLGKRKERQGETVGAETHGSTLFVSNLPYSATTTDLQTLFSDIAPVRSAFVVLDKASGVSKGVGYVAFAIKEDAQDAFDKITKEGISLVGRNLRVQWAGNKPKEGEELVKNEPKPKPKPKRAPKVSKKAPQGPSAASRLIVRNIPFNATEQDLQAVFSPYGPIHSIHIPAEVKGKEPEIKSEATKHARTRGFAFVWMSSKKDAQKAIEGCHGMTVRAGAEEGIDSEKKTKKERRDERLKAADGDDKRATERVIAVDWALSKDRWQEEKAKGPDQDEEEDVDMVDREPLIEKGSDESGDESDDSNEDGNLGVHDGESDEESGDDGGEEEEPVKPQLPPPEDGTTLFVRNVPFIATEDEFRVLFRAFGPLRYARITMDAATGRTRGTGFVCFWNKEDADKVVEQSELLRVQTTGSVATPKKNPFTLPSILTPDPSSSLAHSLVLHGRTLDAVHAVTRDQAGKLRDEGEKKREKADKRNMYLLREGVILPNTPAAETLTPPEIEKRTASYNARRALLRTNPSLFISKTRLSVRQIPIFVTERLLKRLAIHAVRTFEREAKKRSRAGLTEDELAEAEDDHGDDEAVDEEKKAGKGKKLAGRRTGVKQAKIVRQQERVDPVTGKGRSKGYGFLEMHSHADALRVLRWANNNADIDGLFAEWRKDELQDLVKVETSKEVKDEARIARLKEELGKGGAGKGAGKSRGTMIVEFSIENVQVVQRRSARQNDKQPEQKSPEKVTLNNTKTDERLAKKRRVSGRSTPKPVKEESVRPVVGSLIGRKRKERKAKKNGR